MEPVNIPARTIDRKFVISTPWLLTLVVSSLLMALLILGPWHVTRFAQHTSAALQFPYPLDGLEGTILSEARILGRGEALYQPLQPDHYVSASYQPLTYVSVMLAERIASSIAPLPNDATQGNIFFPGRVVSLVGMLLTGLFLALTVWRLGTSKLMGLVALFLWLGFPPVQLWATRIKPDPLALCFTMAGLYCAASYFRQINRAAMRKPFAWLIWAIGLFVFAYFTKQTAIAAPLATAASLLLLSDASKQRSSRLPMFFQQFAWRPLLLFTGIYIGMVGSIWLLLDSLTAGQYTFHAWGLHPSQWWTLALALKYVGLLLTSWPIVVLAGLCLLLVLLCLLSRRFKLVTVEEWRMLVFCGSYVAVASVGLFASGTQGAHHNYLLEPYLAMLLLGCSIVGALLVSMQSCLLETTRRLQPFRPIALVLCLGLLVAQLWVLVDRPDWYGGEFDLQSQERSRVVALIQSMPGEVLADDVALQLAAGRPLRYDEPSTMGPSARVGLWDESNLLSEVAAQRFSLILLPFNAEHTDRDSTGRWSPAFIATLREHYRLLYRDKIYSYVPK